MADFQAGYDPFASGEVKAGVDPFSKQPTQPTQTAQQPTRSIGDELLRQAGLTGRAALSAVGSIGAIPADFIGKGVNAIAGREVIPNQRALIQQQLTRAGLPVPQGGIERFTQGMAENAPSFALPAAVAPQMLGNAAIGYSNAVPGNEVKDATIGAIAGAVPAALAKTALAIGKAGSEILGLTTGAGGESVRQAFKGGRSFTDNMRGNVEPGSVVEQARLGLSSMRQAMRDEYKASIPQWATSKSVDIAPVESAYQNIVQSMQHNGQWKIGKSEIGTLDEIGTVLQDFKSNPSNLTVEGLDALKQRLSAIYPESRAHTQAQRAVTTMVNAAKNEITKQSPAYASAMKNYSSRIDQLDEIERSLSLGNKPTVDTALRKLQSIVRNNVASNYGQRIKSAEAIKEVGGVDILPQVAGQSLSSWTPRGLQGLAATGLGGAAAVSNPAALALLPIGSPRTIGELVNAAGRVVLNPGTQTMSQAFGRATPAVLRSYAFDEERK
jgi:hypothetical protein